jgi:hypothetical protein
MSAAPAQDSQKGCETKNLPTTDTSTVDIIGYIIFIVLVIAACWYGWKFGLQWAPGFWTKIQNYGLSLGKLFGNKGTPTMADRGSRVKAMMMGKRP